jgi:anti-sigma factor RsiW
MTPNFEFYDDSRQHFQGDSPAGNSGSHPDRKDAVNGLKEERFELLSAYLDGEVTAAERLQVEEWLSSEPAIKRWHAQLLNLRHGIGRMPAPAQPQSVEQTLELVFAKLDSQAPASAAQPVALDRFELVSAYLDGEVTAAERRQVEEWLSSEPAVQRLHAQLLALGLEIEAMPAPAAQLSVQQTLEGVFAKLDSSAQSEPAALALEPDRFELVSAYLDGEVTAAERRRVEEWLSSEPAVQRVHAQLLNLRLEIEAMPAPAAQLSAEQTLEGVFAKLDSSAQSEPAALGLEPDRFELVSAYLDGEVTAAERQQVEEWLLSEPAVQRMHAQMLNLRLEIEAMPAPAAQLSVEQTLEGVFAKLDSLAPASAAHTLKRDRFELLSAYLDSEVTAGERQEVESWLACDAEVQGLYARLLSLRSGLQNMPVPAQQPVEKTVEKVFARLDRRPKLAVLWGCAAAVAAMLIAAVSGVLPGEQSRAPQVGTNSSQTPVPSVRAGAAKEQRLMIALNDPIVPIPKPSATPKDKSMVNRALIVE